MSKRYSFRPSDTSDNTGTVAIPSPKTTLPSQEETIEPIIENPDEDEDYPTTQFPTLSVYTSITPEISKTCQEDFDEKLTKQTVNSVSRIIQNLPILCAEVFSSGYSLGIRSSFTASSQTSPEHKPDDVSLYMKEYISSHITGKLPLSISSISSIPYDSPSIEDGKTTRELLGDDQLYLHEVAPLEHATDRVLMMVHELEQLSSDIEDVQRWSGCRPQNNDDKPIPINRLLKDQQYLLSQSSSLLYGIFYQLLCNHLHHLPQHSTTALSAIQQHHDGEMTPENINTLLINVDDVVEEALQQHPQLSEDKVQVYQRLFDYFGALCPFSHTELLSSADQPPSAEGKKGHLHQDQEGEFKEDFSGTQHESQPHKPTKQPFIDLDTSHTDHDHDLKTIHSKLFSYGQRIAQSLAPLPPSEPDVHHTGHPLPDADSDEEIDLKDMLKQGPPPQALTLPPDQSHQSQNMVSSLPLSYIMAGPDKFTTLYPPTPNSVYESVVAFFKVILVTIFICIIALSPALDWV